jgi:hypothetical protein
MFHAREDEREKKMLSQTHFWRRKRRKKCSMKNNSSRHGMGLKFESRLSKFLSFSSADTFQKESSHDIIEPSSCEKWHFYM